MKQEGTVIVEFLLPFKNSIFVFFLFMNVAVPI